MQQLHEALMFTDIHWGKKQNSDAHNLNCLNFIKFVVKHVKKSKTIDHIVMMGDWFENRSAVNISTMNFAYQGAKLLNELGLPVFFIIGNHDLYTRVHRDIHSVIMYNEFSNFTVIAEPLFVEHAGPEGALMCPFLFHHEYNLIQQYKDVPVFFGHFELQGFVVTGQNVVMADGPSHKLFHNQTRVFSGHFHKRQAKDNIVYIGNTFPMEYGDANDTARGFAIYNYAKDSIKFVDWLEGPQYIKTSLSQLLEGDVKIPENSFVKCVADYDINYEEYTKLRKVYTQQHNLKEFIIEEPPTVVYIMDEDGNEEDIDDIELEITTYDTEEIIVTSLQAVSAPSIDTNLLISIYRDLGEQ